MSLNDIYLVGAGWTAFRLQRLGMWNTGNTAMFPRTTEIIKSLNIPLAVRGVMFAKQTPSSGVFFFFTLSFLFSCLVFICCTSYRSKASFGWSKFHSYLSFGAEGTKILLDCSRGRKKGLEREQGIIALTPPTGYVILSLVFRESSLTHLSYMKLSMTRQRKTDSC